MLGDRAKKFFYVHYNCRSKVLGMKINSIENHNFKPAFYGFKPVKNNLGLKEYEFNFPFDDANYECCLEIFKVKKDENTGDYRVVDIVENIDEPDGVLRLKSGSNKINLAASYCMAPNEAFAYHYKVKGNNWKDYSYQIDAGDVLDETDYGRNPHRIYNIVTENATNLTHGGAMKLVIADNFNAGYVYNPILFQKEYSLNKKLLQNAQTSVKNFSNKVGGTLAGIKQALDEGKFDGYSSIISLPIFTDDSLTPHSYWNKNCMQMAHSLGNINNYASLQRKMFAKGLNFVSDGAFVNEGLEGVHFANILKYGPKSPFYNWFKAEGLKDGPLLLGVFGKDTEHVSQKIVNSPYKYTQKANGIVKWSRNKDYNSAKPTYVQIFDDRLVSDELKNDTKNLISSYDILRTQNPYEINSHDDTVINYHFEINPETFHNNIQVLNEYNSTHSDKALMNKISGMRILDKFENFELEEKMDGGFYAWDANSDIAKLNFSTTHTDTIDLQNHSVKEREKIERLERNRMQVQDYVVKSGQYWTRKTADILRLNAAQNLKNINNKSSNQVYQLIKDNIKNEVFPKRLADNINEAVVRNVLNDNYYLPRREQFSDEKFDKQVLMGLMNLPLDTIEFGDNIVSAFASPYITKWATSDDEIGLSRYDLYKKGNPHLDDEYVRAYTETDKLYENEMSDFAQNILQEVGKKLSVKLKSGDDVTEYGKYVLPLLTTEIAKFAVIKSLKPDAKVFVDKNTGEIGYDYNELKDFHLQSLKIFSTSPEYEARSLIHKIKSGINKISSKDKEILVAALTKSLEGTSVESFALADVIVDRAQAGLDWRIDASKDISDIDALRNRYNSFDFAWLQITDFWKKFTTAVLDENPNAYIVSEVTDEDDFYDPEKNENWKLHNAGIHDFSKYKDKYDIRRKMINEIKLTSIANYRHIFSAIPELFGKSFENGSDTMGWDRIPSAIYEKMIGQENYLQSSNLQSLLYSYTFAGNHDKPRALHCLALDMGLFYADLNNSNNYDYRKRAYKVLTAEENDNNVTGDKVNKFNYKNYSPKAIAMGEAMKRGLYGVVNNWYETKKISEERKNILITLLSKSISDLAKGSYCGENFAADGFGVKPIDINLDSVITQAQKTYGLQLSKDERAELFDKSFEIVMKPAMQKLDGIMQFLVALPGKPTLYSGDELASTGYESKTKNIYVQNRNYIHNEWLKTKQFVKDFNEKIENTMALRSRPELDALNNGAPFTLRKQTTTNGLTISALLHQNTDGKMAISLFNPYGLNRNPDGEYNPEKVWLNEINLDAEDKTNKIGLRGGLRAGTVFRNADVRDKSEYIVRSENGRYFIKRHIDGHDADIEINDATLNLYYVPNNSKVAFTGKIDYKPMSGMIVAAYGKSL